mmetsp:Transcript_98503/g.234506  ORF Transcript_98503/g.234506 Transcript_98503/m.234506 type:complete len:1850 (-) Transcript_98503:140-5689(-)
MEADHLRSDVLKSPRKGKYISRRHSAANVPNVPAKAEGRRTSISARRSSLVHGRPAASGRRASLSDSGPGILKGVSSGRRLSADNSGRRLSTDASARTRQGLRRPSAVSVANVRRASLGSVGETLQQARSEAHRLSQSHVYDTAKNVLLPPAKDATSPRNQVKRASTTPVLVPEIVSLAPSEELCGVQVRKPSDKAKAEEYEGQHAAPKMSENGKLLKQTRLFSRLSDQALIDLADNGEERFLRFSEVLYREGEKQNQDWLGLVISGALTYQIESPDREKGDPLPMLQPGMLFGELGALNICQARTSTVAADVDSKVLVIRSESIWQAVNGSHDDVKRISNECDCWRAFMSCEFASMCHPEVAYQLRAAATLRKVVQGEEHVLGVKNQQRQLWAAAVIERGQAYVKETDEVMKGPDTINVVAMLGVRSSCTVMSHGDKGCHIAVLDRTAFWNLMRYFPKEREVFTRWTLQQLPSATADISSVPMLQYLEGSQSFFRALAGSIRQRVVPPGSVAMTAKDVFEMLVFLQQGLADILFRGHKVRELCAGQSVGELNLLSIQAMAGMTVMATEFCVLQELKKADVESHLVKHPVARSRWRELLKIRNVWKQEGAMERQIIMLRDSPFFGDEVSADFMRLVHQQMEVRLFFPEQKIQKEDDPGDVMFLFCEGLVELQTAAGEKSMLEAAAVVGEAGLISNVEGPRDVLTAKTTCALMALHRMNMIDALKRFPEAKPHFEAAARRSRKGTHEEGEQYWNIYRMSCFKDCGSRFLYLVDLHLERHIFFSDEIVVTENTEGEDMYILYSGAMDVKVKGIKVGSLEGGMFFGEMAVLGLVKKRSATIVAKSLCDVRILSRKSLEEAIHEFPQELARFEELAATRNRLSLEHRNGGRVRHLCSFFQDCNAEFATAIADDMQDRLFTAGQVIVREDSNHESLFLIHQGAAAVTYQGQKVSELKSGDVCGELVAMGLSPVPTATVTATDTCFVQELPKRSLKAVLERYPEQTKQLRQMAAARMEWKHSLNDLNIFEWVKNAPLPVAHLLEQLMTRWFFFCGDEMLVQGAEGDSLFLISTGSVEILHNEKVIRALGAGDMVGELGALGVSSTRTTTVRCKDICDVYILAKAALQQVLALYPSAQDPLRKLATVRMRSDVERMSEKHVLLHCPLFQQSSRKFLDKISEHMEDRLFMEGEDLCKEGEKGDTMFILVQGVLNVCVLKDGQNIKVNELHKGSVIGEITVLGLANHRTATLTAQQVCLVQVLHRPILMKYLNEFPREIVTFQEVGASRLAKSGVSKSTLFPQQVLFKDCSPPFLDALCKQLQRKICFPGQVIVEEGTESQEMYAIAQGEASVEKGGQRLGEIQQGFAFGEMAVLRLTSGQPVTIKAERMCDLQYLNCYDLETLLESYPRERERLLKVVAFMMREELAEVTDEEVLGEVPLLAYMGEGFIKRLAAHLQVSVVRKGELIKGKKEELFLVLLQGKACVQIDGITLREMCEGESYGEASALGLVPCGDSAEVRAAAGSVSLYLWVPKEAVQRALHEGAHVRDKLRGTVVVPPGIHKSALASSALKHMKFSEDQIHQLLARCEECFCMADKEMLSIRQSIKQMLFMLSGKASYQKGEEKLNLVPGGSLVHLSKSTPSLRSPVIATTNCKYLLLNKRVFLEFIKAQPEQERQRLLQRLESMPGQARAPATLRQMSDRIGEQCLHAAKAALKDNMKPWDKPKARFAATLPGAPSSMQTSHVNNAPIKVASTKSLSSHEVPKRSLPKKMDDLDKQEAMFCKDMRRLTLTARACAKDAMRELFSLRSQADHLRAQLKNMASGSPKADLSQSAPQDFRRTRHGLPRSPRSPRVMTAR